MPNVRRETALNEVEMLMPVLSEVRARAGLHQQDIGFTCSGSTDYLSGQAFSFVSTLDGVGPWPPIQESHVEIDRKIGVEGKSVSVRVDLGGRRIIKKKKKEKHN